VLLDDHRKTAGHTFQNLNSELKPSSGTEPRLGSLSDILNIILNVSGLVLIHLKILKTCTLPLSIIMLPSSELNEPTLLSFHLVLSLARTDTRATKNPLNSFQSADIKHHSTETTLLSVHDQIIKSNR